MEFKTFLILLGIVISYEFVPASSTHFHHHRRRILQSMQNAHMHGVDQFPPLSVMTKFPRPSPVIDVNRIVRFKLYTRQNRYAPEEISVDKPMGYAVKRFKAEKKTKILIHGFVDSATESTAGEWMNYMREAYLNAEDVNVIVVDYSIVALFLFYWTNLPHLASGRLAELLYFLNKNGSPYDSFHVVGRSWGAHVAGMTGHSLCGKLGRITGLDPANPPFRFVGFEYRLDQTDAQFVDVYHLNGKNRFSIFNVVGISTKYDGLSSPVGHVDVYPNFKERQMSGCPIHNASFYTETCRLGLGARFFTETITKPNVFPMCKCESFLKYIRGECKCEDNKNMISMGEYIAPGTTGVYQLTGSLQLVPVTVPPQRPTETIPILGVSSSNTSTASPSTTTSTTTEGANQEDVPPETSTTTVAPSTTLATESSSSTASQAVPESSSTTETPTIAAVSEDSMTSTTTSTTSTTTTTTTPSASTSEKPEEEEEVVSPTANSLSKDGQAISGNAIQ